MSQRVSNIPAIMRVDPYCATTVTATASAAATTVVTSVSAGTTSVNAVTPTTDTATTTVAPSHPSTSSKPSSSRPISPLPQPSPHPDELHKALHLPSQSLHTAQALPVRTSNAHPNSQLTITHDQRGDGALCPIASSGCGFTSKGIRPLSMDQMVTVASPGGRGYPPPSLVFPHGVRSTGSPHLHYLNHPLMTRLPNLRYGSAVNGVPVSSHPKAAPRTTISDSNGNKDTRDRSRDDNFIIIKDRKIKEDASLYALCRSWLRNITYEKWQVQQRDVIKALPKSLPAVVASFMSNKKDEEEQENEKSVENLTPRDILQKHIKRSKTVRARLREQRLQRISRYRTRLSLLLPSPAEKFRNDTAAGN